MKPLEFQLELNLAESMNSQIDPQLRAFDGPTPEGVHPNDPRHQRVLMEWLRPLREALSNAS